MASTRLLEKLLEIERSLGYADSLVIRGMLMDAEAQVLALQQELMAVLVEVRLLREQRAASSPAPFAVARTDSAGAQGRPFPLPRRASY